MYYYWDNVNQNIRYVCLESGQADISPAQLAWFASIAQSCPTNAHIVILTHAIWNTKTALEPYRRNVNLIEMCDAINTRTTYTYNDVTYDFTSITAKVSAILCGHIHAIRQEYFGTSLIPVISLEADMYEGTNIIFSQKIHCVDIDFTNAKIYIFTLGYNIDDSQSRDIKQYNIVV